MVQQQPESVSRFTMAYAITPSIADSTVKYAATFRLE